LRNEVTESEWRAPLMFVEDDPESGMLLNSGMPVAIFERAESRPA